MPTYLFQAKSAAPLPPGCVARFVLIMPGPNGAFSREQLIEYAQTYSLGTRGVGYGITEINHAIVKAPIVVTEISLGNGMTPQAAPAAMSGEHFRGGQPTGSPIPQGGVPRTDGPMDRSGFQKLGDQALDGGIDDVYGSSDDGTVSDLIVEGGGAVREVRRS